MRVQFAFVSAAVASANVDFTKMMIMRAGGAFVYVLVNGMSVPPLHLPPCTCVHSNTGIQTRIQPVESSGGGGVVAAAGGAAAGAPAVEEKEEEVRTRTVLD